MRHEEGQYHRCTRRFSQAGWQSIAAGADALLRADTDLSDLLRTPAVNNVLTRNS